MEKETQGQDSGRKCRRKHNLIGAGAGAALLYGGHGSLAEAATYHGSRIHGRVVEELSLGRGPSQPRRGSRSIASSSCDTKWPRYHVSLQPLKVQRGLSSKSLTG